MLLIVRIRYVNESSIWISQPFPSGGHLDCPQYKKYSMQGEHSLIEEIEKVITYQTSYQQAIYHVLASL